MTDKIDPLPDSLRHCCHRCINGLYSRRKDPLPDAIHTHRPKSRQDPAAERRPIRFSRRATNYDRSWKRAQRDFLHDLLRHCCDPWVLSPKLFLECYFAYISEQVEANETQLAEKLAPYGALLSVQDWILSAPRPLPRAHIRAGRTYWPDEARMSRIIFITRGPERFAHENALSTFVAQAA